MSFLKEVGPHLTVNCLQAIEGNWKTELGGKLDGEHSSCLQADRGTRHMASVWPLCTEIKVNASLLATKAISTRGFHSDA